MKSYVNWRTGLILVLLLTGCASPGEAGTAAPAPTTGPRTLTLPGDDWGYPSPFAFYSRGPGYVRMSLLFDSLTWKDADGVIPWLAERWTTSEDGTTWTFTLRDDVTWHDGAQLTAEDVAFTFRYFQAHPEAFTWSWSVDRVTQVEAADARTVTVTLDAPLAGAHETLFGSLPIIPAHVWADVDDPARYLEDDAVLGSGPFTLSDYSKAEGRYRYAANPGYFRGVPTVDALTFVKVENQALALETGEIDWASFSGKERTAVESLRDNPDYGVLEGPSFWVLQLIFNTQRAPLDAVAVRRAIAHAVDREAIVTQVTHDGAVVASTGILSPFSPWHAPDLPTYPHDPAAARETLAAEGAAGSALTLITTPNYAREAELVQADLRAVGLEVAVQTGDRSTIDGLLREGTFDLAINGHGGIANPATLQTPTWPADVYDNPTYAARFAEQATLVDADARREVVAELQLIVAEELPVLTLWHPKMWTVYDVDAPGTWFYTQGGMGLGIPIAMNKLSFLE